jgi:hypothetical protein
MKKKTFLNQSMASVQPRKIVQRLMLHPVVANLPYRQGSNSKNLYNDGAKWNRLLYLKIMYTAIKKILHLQKIW